ncbi:sodium transporter [Termitidicoccus mucosus]|uniref:Sodium transporter n=3 Tax=Termitidicoccus mucosus TaxID=1184151 RepID=A0A178IJ38_9BACT|nr:sodium transporter [Opitutaceae bacterium TSB47]
MHLNPIDLSVIIIYFVSMIGMGLRLSGKNKTTDGYFLGGRNFPGWAIGISFIGAMISSVTFIAYPADSFKTAWIRLVPNFAFPVVVIISAYMFIPFFRRGTVNSAYQYLSMRFGNSVSVYAAVVFMLAQILRTATVAYLVAILLAPMTGVRIEWCILIAGGITALYTIKGGFTAVIWTDVIQTVILVAGAAACIIFVTAAIPGGLGTIFSESWAAGKLSFMDLNAKTGELEPMRGGFSLSEKTVIMLLLVGFVQYVAGKLNQETVQRWCSARTPGDAKRSMIVLGIGSVPIWAMFMFLGTCLWVYFQHFPSSVSVEILSGLRKAEEILPHFIVSVLPPGLAGLVISAALAAAMSTLSSGINTASMVWVRDIYQPYFAKGRDDRHYLRMGLGASLGISILMIGGAFLFYFADTKTLMDFSIIVTALLGGGISGAFLFGMLTRRGDARAVLIGIVATALFTVYATLMQFGIVPRIFDSYYTSIIGNIIMFAVSYGAACLLPEKPRDLKNLTVFDQSKEQLV